MSWKVSINHRTTYAYAGTVQSSYNEARVTPLTTDRQLVVDSSVKISPQAPAYRYWDYWGTMVHAFDIHEPHTELVVTGSSVVETSTPRPPNHVEWNDFDAAAAGDEHAELLTATGYVPIVDDLSAVASELAAANPPWDACEAAAGWVHEHLRYEKGITHVATTAPEALDHGAGVCQDFAHLTLALLRSMGIPARYVSGYVFPSEEAEVGQDVAGQSHAWVEAWTGEWSPLDPTHAVPVGQRHVVVARGRDYADVPPLRGVFHGGPAQGLTVTVDLTRLA